MSDTETKPETQFDSALLWGVSAIAREIRRGRNAARRMLEGRSPAVRARVRAMHEVFGGYPLWVLSLFFLFRAGRVRRDFCGYLMMNKSYFASEN
jgi:hypothetical protein